MQMSPYYIRTKVVYGLYRLLFRLLAHGRFKPEVSGGEDLPRGSFIIASNHLGRRETVLIPAAFEVQVAMVAKKELTDKLVIGRLIKGGGGIPVVRHDPKDEDTAEFMSQVKRALNHGRAVGIFPEGTRSKSGLLQGFEKGVAIMAMKNRCPVVPVGVSYLRGKAYIRIGAPLNVADYSAREFVSVLRHKIAELSGQHLATPDGSGKIF